MEGSLWEIPNRKDVVSATGQNLAFSTRDVEAAGVANQGRSLMASGLPANVQETIDKACAPSTKRLYLEGL